MITFPFRHPVAQRTKFVMAHEVQMSAAERRKHRHQRQNQPVVYQKGEQVLIKFHRLSSAADRTIHKLFLLYEGPYKIDRQVWKNAYLVKDHTGHMIGTYNIINLKKYLADTGIT